MDKDYRKNQQRLTELAAAFADRCARAEQTAGKAHAANREAYKQRSQALYENPRHQLETDLRQCTV